MANISIFTSPHAGHHRSATHSFNSYGLATLLCVGVIALAGLSACGDSQNESEPGNEPEVGNGSGNGSGDEMEESIPNALDLLFVIESSSRGLCEEHNRLVADLEPSLQVLMDAGVDLHFAVVNMDMNDPAGPGHLQHGPGNYRWNDCMRAFVPTDIDTSGCSELDVNVLSPGAYDSPSEFIQNATCLAKQGTSANSFPKGLEVIKQALSVEMTSPGAPNEGFLREEAALGIVILSNKNDCSHDGAIEELNGYICEWYRDQLTPVSEYIDFVSALKSDVDRIAVHTITGDDDGRRYEPGETGDGLGATCNSEWGGPSFNGYRYHEFAAAFGSANTSVCGAFGLVEFAEGLVDRLNPE